jgi:uncharacterized Fe-S cluster-containing radical SAM superfamily protein
MRNNTSFDFTESGLFDPLQKAEEIRAVVCRDDKRKYYRFRPARFYGGIATADCVGCCLRCLFCWSWDKVVKPDRFGTFYSPVDVAGRLVQIVRRKHYHRVRISGNEPTLGRDHLMQVIRLLPGTILFILETNGILIGADSTYAHDLAQFDNVIVRVSLKGCSDREFSTLTGATARGFELQLQAVENLHRAGVRVQPAVMVSFSSPESMRDLQLRLGSIHRDLRDPEVEEVILYGNVAERLTHAHLRYLSAYDPDTIRDDQV